MGAPLSGGRRAPERQGPENDRRPGPCRPGAPGKSLVSCSSSTTMAAGGPVAIGKDEGLVLEHGASMHRAPRGSVQAGSHPETGLVASGSTERSPARPGRIGCHTDPRPTAGRHPVSSATPAAAAPTPSWSSTSARSTPSSSPAVSARPGSTARSCRAPCRSPRCSPRTPRRSSSPAAPRRCTRRARPRLDRALFEAGVPVFGMCYGFQLMAHHPRRHRRQHRRP